MEDEKGNLHSEKDGKFVAKDNSEEKLSEAERIYNSEPMGNEKSTDKKMTPAEKIASVHIDFDRDNILPELNEEDLKKIGAKKNKPVLLKKNIIDRNASRHPDITEDDIQRIIANALYNPSEIFQANANKPYYHFAKVVNVNSKGKSEIGLALLDVDENKDNFEVVHAHFVNMSGLQRVKNNKKD